MKTHKLRIGKPISIFAILFCMSLSFSAFITINNSKKAFAEEIDYEVELGETKYQISNNKDYLLMVTPIKNVQYVYEVGYVIENDTVGETDRRVNNKYFESITNGANTWTAQNIYGGTYTDNTPLIVWEIEYDSTKNYNIKAYAKCFKKVGDNYVDNGSVYSQEREVAVASEVQYKVEHYQQNLNDDNYTKIDTDELTGLENNLTEATTKNYTGFVAKSYEQATISSDGSTVVKIYYDRNKYTVTWKNGTATVETDTNVKYGTMPSFDGATPSKAMDDTNIYTFTGWGEIVAVNGDVTYTAQYSQKTITSKTYNTGKVSAYDSNNTLVVDTSKIEGFEGTVNKVYVNNTKLTPVISGTNATVSYSGDSGNATIIVETENNAYKLSIVIEKVYVLNDAQALHTFFENIKSYNENDLILLDSDVNGTGLAPIVAAANDRYFKGTFDGQGHVISNFAVSYTPSGGLFGELGNGTASGHIKNFALLGVNVNNTANYCYLLSNNLQNSSTIENVYVEGVSQSTSGIARLRSVDASISNVIVNAQFSNTTNANAFSSQTGDDKNKSQLTNCYAITNGGFAIDGTPQTNCAKYTNVDEFFNSVVDLSQQDGWASYWSLTNGSLSFGGTTLFVKTIETTYSDKYVQLANSKTLIDTSKIVGDLGTVNAVEVDGASKMFTVSGNTVSVDSLLTGSQSFTLRTTNGDYSFTTIVADYLITDQATFKSFRENNANYKYAVLTQDITCDGTTDISANGTPYVSTLDGLGYKITNAYFRYGWSKSGANFNAGVIRNVIFENYIVAENGIFGGYMQGGLIENVTMMVTYKQGYNTAGAWTSIICHEPTGRGDNTLLIKNTNFYITVPENVKYNAIKLYQDENYYSTKMQNIVIVSNGLIAKPDEPDCTGTVRTHSTKTEWTNVQIIDNRATVETQLLTSGNITLNYAKTVKAVYLDGAKVSATQSGSTLTIPATVGRRTIVIQDTDGFTTKVIAVADKLIANYNDFSTFMTSQINNYSYVVLTNDIDCNNQSVLAVKKTSGVIDGNNYKISNMATQKGFFNGEGNNFTLCNIVLDNITTPLNADSGILGRYLGANTVFANVKVINTTLSSNYVLCTQNGSTPLFVNCDFTLTAASGKENTNIYLTKTTYYYMANILNTTISCTNGSIGDYDDTLTEDNNTHKYGYGTDGTTVKVKAVNLTIIDKNGSKTFNK